MRHDNAVRRVVEDVLRQYRFPRYAIVDSYDPKTHRAKVVIQPSEDGMALTGFLPVTSPMVGNGWGVHAPLSKGDQVMVIYGHGQADGGTVFGPINDTPDHLPPFVANPSASPTGKPMQPGEFALVHPSGAYVTLTNDNKIRLNGTVEIDAGNLANAVQTLCTQAMRDWAAGHTHANSGGSGTGGPPTAPPPASALTTILRAN